MSIKGKIYDMICKVIPQRKKYEMDFYRIHGRKLNMDNPKTLTEKLYWVMRYNELYKIDLIREIYDKYFVRDYIKEKGYEDILVPLYVRFTSADEINEDALANDCILKITQSSGMNIICKDKNNFDLKAAKIQLNKWLKESRKKHTRMGGFYFDGKSSIICEKLIYDKNGNIPDDIRFYCFNGEPMLVQVDIDTIDENNNKKKMYHRNTYDIHWNLLDVDFYRTRNKQYIKEKPQNFNRMIEIARELSKDFIFVRVDLYNVDGKIYFGELTPVPGNGGEITPHIYDKEFGDLLKLPNVKLF